MTTGSTIARFTITLSKSVAESVQVAWNTKDGTAKAGIDYAAASGTAVFSPGETNKDVDVLVYGRAVGTEDRNFFLEMTPPPNAILGESIGECIIYLDTAGNTAVIQVIVPTGPQGAKGDSAYQSWLNLGNTGTEQDFIDSLIPPVEEIAAEVAPILDISSSPLTADGTDNLGKPDTMTGKALARRIAYVGATKIATVLLASGDNLIGQSDLTGDAVDFSGVCFYPRIVRGSNVISPDWSVELDGKLLIKAAVAGDVLYACQYDTISDQAIDNRFEVFSRLLAAPSGAGLIGVKTSEETLEHLLSSDDMAIKYGHVNSTISERLARAGAKVVLVGDSLSSFFNIDAVNTASIFESYLRRKVREFNPSAKFYNRAIGGKRYYDLGRNEPPLTYLTSGYPWYNDTTKRWMTYLDELKPDVIFLAFGMNDGAGWDAGNFQQDNFFKMMEELRSISSSPELVFCTNILPSTTHIDSAPEDQQIGRDAMAGWTRSFSRKEGYSCIDLHRRFKCLRDGVDPCMSSYARKTIQKVVTLPYVHPVQCGMYSARVILIDPAVATVGITFKLSSYPNNFLTLKYDAASGRWKTTAYTATVASVGIAEQGLASGPAPVAGTEIYFTMNGDVVVITIGINTYPVFSRNVARFGGKFAPEISGTGDIKVDLIEGTPVPVKSELTDYDCYNTDGDGGNGLNHPTAKASSRVYTRVVDDWFGMLAGSIPSRRHVLDIDFVNGTMTVRNPYSPEVSGENKLSSALTFVAGALAYQRDAQGQVLGAVFGATNRAYIDQAIFNAYAGSYSQLNFEVEFIAPGAQAYLFSFGENVTSDRLLAQVTSDLRPRVTASVAAQASDLHGSLSFPYVAGRKYALNFSIDCAEAVVRMWGADNSARGNINTTTVANISAATLSKLKLGYLSESAFGADVVISRIKAWFSN